MALTTKIAIEGHTRHHLDGLRCSVVIVGGGQAGLSMSYCLTQHGVDHIVLERDRIGHEWRDRRWTQIHSSQYRRPDQLPPGEVLVIGTGQSGCQIAEDLHLAGRRVHLAVGSAPRVARFYRGRDVVA